MKSYGHFQLLCLKLPQYVYVYMGCDWDVTVQPAFTGVWNVEHFIVVPFFLSVICCGCIYVYFCFVKLMQIVLLFFLVLNQWSLVPKACEICVDGCSVGDDTGTWPQGIVSGCCTQQPVCLFSPLKVAKCYCWQQLYQVWSGSKQDTVNQPENKNKNNKTTFTWIFSKARSNQVLSTLYHIN